MIQDLKIYQWQGQAPISPIPGPQFFVLNTCQRTLYLGFQSLPAQNVYSDHQYFEGQPAYQYLLEIICGLKSKLIGEYEIVGQFKKAYTDYTCHSKNPNSLILRFLEKLFKDAKQIRTKHLTCLGVQTYAGISRQIIKEKAPGKKILVLGSGQLAENFIRISRKMDITIAARNQDRVDELCLQYGIKSVDFKNNELLETYPIIYNTLGPEAQIWQSTFYVNWLLTHLDGRLLIDLTKKTMLQNNQTKAVGVLTLEDIFLWGEQMGFEKSGQIEKAKTEIKKCVTKRALDSSSTFPFGWEELNFA